MADSTDFFALSTINVVLTYVFTEPPTAITFPTAVLLDADAIEARQAFYAKPDGDRVAGAHAYNVDMLARMIVARPVGLPGFDEFLKERGFDGPGPIDAIRDALREFLAEPSPMKRKVAVEAVERYSMIVQPNEFFR